MKFGLRVPSFKKRIAARTSWKRYARHSLGLKAPRGWGWLTNPKKAAYNRVYNRTTFGVRAMAKSTGNTSILNGCFMVVVAVYGILGLAALAHGSLFPVLLMGVLAWLVAKLYGKAARRRRLVERFGEAAAKAILEHRFWQGATRDMMIESLGSPVDVKESVYKTKVKHTYCYQPVAKNRYALRLYLEDGVVVGWDNN